MKISSKGKYALASMTMLAQNYKSEMPVSVINISNFLGISKIYLEQVFALLKRAELVTSSKGAYGGYRLKTDPVNILIYDILFAVENSLFEKPENILGEDGIHYEDAMLSLLWSKLDKSIEIFFKNITLDDLLNETLKVQSKDDYMFFI